ncbi:MAG: radical SAM protein [Candidatus Aenigmatarchaeota archaeon]
MQPGMKIREIQCKSAIGKCDFPGGGFAINPYIGCGHGCAYCYARFIKRFTGHAEEWGRFVDVRTNTADVLRKQMKSSKYKSQQIYIGTVTDPYQPMEAKYRITRKALEVLLEHDNPVSILTKSDKVLDDIDLLKQFKKVDVNFTVTSLDEKWVRFTEPRAPSVKQRLAAMKKLSGEGITVYAMMGPYWPFFTDPEKLFKEFKKAGVKRVFTESFNTTGGNFTGVENVLKKYSEHLAGMKEILFDSKRFYEFYREAENKVKHASRKYNIPTTVYFGLGHAAKFRQS